MVTGAIGEEAAAECIRLGAADYLLKDRLARLGAAVEQAVAATRLRAAKRQADEALVDSEQRARQAARDHKALIENASDAILIFEPDTEVILEANAAACEAYGYPHDELVGLSLQTLTEDVARGKARMAGLKRDRAEPELPELFTSGGTARRFHVVSNATLVEYRGRQAVMSIVRDVEEAFVAEEERRRLVRDLGERVKELTLLHRAARLFQNDEMDLPALLEHLVALLPHGWQHSHLVAARVAIGACEYRTVNWAETTNTQQIAFDTREGPGLLQVAYTEVPSPLERPALPRRGAAGARVARRHAASVDRSACGHARAAPIRRVLPIAHRERGRRDHRGLARRRRHLFAPVGAAPPGYTGERDRRPGARLPAPRRPGAGPRARDPATFRDRRVAARRAAGPRHRGAAGAISRAPAHPCGRAAA